MPAHTQNSVPGRGVTNGWTGMIIRASKPDVFVQTRTVPVVV